MEKISEMIKRLCPDGVEKVPLWEITAWDKKFNAVDKSMQKKIIKYNYLLAKELDDIIDNSGDIRILYTTEDIAYTTEEKAEGIISEGEVVAIPWGGNPTVKYYNGRFVTGDNRIATSLDKSRLDNKYLYYWMVSQLDVISTFYRGAGIKHPSMFCVLTMELPLPPLLIQQEIVRILDSFTSLITNLETELASRQKQYEHYRNELLTFDENDESVEWKTLGEVITRLRTGLNPRVHFKLNTADAIGHYVTVRELKGFSIEVDDKTDRINEAAIRRINERSKLKEGDVLFSGTGTIGRTAIVEEEPRKWNIKEGVYALTPNLKMITSRFMIYSLHTIGVVTQIENKAGGSTVKSIPMTELKNIIIPVPSLIRQQEIVSTLDTFESLISNIKQELEARKKQYEYYREQLLTFE